jgi:hypothetical protein
MQRRGLPMALTAHFRETIASRINSDPEFVQALTEEAASLMLQGEVEAALLLMNQLTPPSSTPELRGMADARSPDNRHSNAVPSG